MDNHQSILRQQKGEPYDKCENEHDDENYIALAASQPQPLLQPGINDSPTLSRAKNRLIDALLMRLQAKGDLKHFSFVVWNDPFLQQQLEQATDKRECVKLMLELGQNQGYHFTSEEVRAISGSWATDSVEQFLSLFLKLSNRGLAQFLRQIKSDRVLQTKLYYSHSIPFDRETFAARLVQLGKGYGYTFTLEEVRNILGRIPDIEIPDPEKPINGFIPDVTPTPPEPPPVEETPSSSQDKVRDFLKRQGLKLLLASVVCIPLLLWLAQFFRPAPPRPAATLYADPVRGNDRNNGTLSTPFKTLSHALSQATDGDIIQLAPGQYSNTSGESLPLSLPAKVTVSIQPDASSRLLSDVQASWAAKFIQPLIARGILKGYPDGKFYPDDLITRSEFAAMLTKTFNLPEAQSIKNFQDVSNDFWGYDVIQRAYSYNFLKGFPNDEQNLNDDTFSKPAEAPAEDRGYVTREQVITALVSGLRLTSPPPILALDAYYTDGINVSDWAKPAVKAATVEQLVVNYDNPAQLKPQSSATRAEVAALFYQALVKQRQMPTIDSIYIVKPKL